MKKTIYGITIAISDFIGFILIGIVSLVLLGGWSALKVGYEFYMIISIISSLKLIANIALKNYNLLWMYSIRKNMVKLICIVLSVNTFFLILSLIPAINEYSHITFNLFMIIVAIEFCYLVISRFAVSVYMNHFYRRNKKNLNNKTNRTLIVGAGSAGSMVLNELAGDNRYGYKVVGFVDDSKDKIGTYINNVKVFGPISNLNEIASKLEAEKIVLAIPSAGISKIKEITNSINYKNISVEILPDKSKLLQSNLSSNIRKVEISDLLGRTPIELDKSKLNEFISGKTVLVTGGGGSIGSEICRQVLDYNPKQLIIFDIYENTTYELKMELDIKYRNLNKEPNYLCLIGSVRDQARLDEVFNKYKPNLVFHAAAHKHVPLMEDSPHEAIKNNVKGTYNVAMMADKYNVEKMVLISTDKAVNPTNVMGATKRFCEMIVEAWDSESKNTRYSMVRFGNVLGSNGSVIPLFRRQIEAGGPLTVTSEKINRFFMTIPEACGLVIQSGAYAKGGEKFILDMGEPVKIIDLAKNMIKLSGLELGKDIDIEITGLRPGEKLYEELLLKTANATKTENDKIYVEYANKPFNLKEIENIIDKLVSLAYQNKEILEYLKELEIIKVKDLNVVTA